MRTLGLFEILLIALVVLLLCGGPLVPRMAASLGRRVRTAVDQACWVYESMAGTEEKEIEAESRVGRQMAQAFREQTPPDPDPQANERVARLGRRLAETEAARKRTFTFQVVGGAAANAYALPGGYVFITRRLLDMCEEDDEVAFVLAHEMGHVLCRHFLAKYTLDIALQHVRAGQLIGQLLGKGYSREQEHEADRAGVALAQEAGFGSGGALRFFRKLAARSPEHSLLAEYLSTHPAPAERIAALRQS